MLSVIIPTLNERLQLKSTIKHTLDNAFMPGNIEIIVIDAGSSDGTLQSIAEFDVKCFSKPEFSLQKFKSLNFGLSVSSAKFIMFLDADTLLPKHFDVLIQNVFSDKRIVAGAFEFSFLNAGIKLKILTLINRIRYRVSKIYYGDQAIFVRRETLNKINGVPEKPLMESAYLCRALKKEGRLDLIKVPIKTSPRRFTKYGFFKVTWFDLIMFIRFKLGLPVFKYAKRYWSKNLID